MRGIQYRGYIKSVGVMLPVDSIHFGAEVVGFNLDGDIYEHDFNDVVLMQSTEIIDSAGELIFEGDILRYEWNDKEKIDVIEYQGNMFTYRSSIRWSLYEDEIIGNIYENAELMEDD